MNKMKWLGLHLIVAVLFSSIVTGNAANKSTLESDLRGTWYMTYRGVFPTWSLRCTAKAKISSKIRNNVYRGTYSSTCHSRLRGGSQWEDGSKAPKTTRAKCTHTYYVNGTEIKLVSTGSSKGYHHCTKTSHWRWNGKNKITNASGSLGRGVFRRIR